jgi:hypothetical protein
MCVMTLLVSGILTAGCTPRPPKPVNCRMADWEERRSRGKSSADTVLVAKVTESRHYATTWGWRGTYYWHFVACQVLAVEKGRWEGRDLAFVEWDFAPADFMLDKAMFPFREGSSFTFFLDTRGRPPTIIWWEERKEP